MQALEKYPPFPGQNPAGEADEYGYAEEQLKKMNEDGKKQKYIVSQNAIFAENLDIRLDRIGEKVDPTKKLSSIFL